MRNLIRISPLLAIIMCGCAVLRSNNFVVRVEQTQTVAAATFDMVLTLDNNNRQFWATNLPAFHEFCEWLRAPQTVLMAKGNAPNSATVTVPRVIAIQLALDNTKVAFKAGRAGSNDLATALAVVESALAQAQTWSTTTRTLK